MDLRRESKSQMLVLEARRQNNSNLIIYASVSDESVPSLDETSNVEDTNNVSADENWWQMPENQELYRKLLKYHKLVLYSLAKQYQYDTDMEEFSSILVSEIDPAGGSTPRSTTPRPTNISIEGGKRTRKKHSKMLLPVEIIHRSFGSLKKWRPSLKRKRNEEDS